MCSVSHDSPLLHVYLVQAYAWQVKRSPEEVTRLREGAGTGLLRADRGMRASGLVEEWFRGADPVAKGVSGAANGHLFTVLLEAFGYRDVACANLLREGRVARVHLCMCVSCCVLQVGACWKSYTVAELGLPSSATASNPSQSCVGAARSATRR